MKSKSQDNKEKPPGVRSENKDFFSVPKLKTKKGLKIVLTFNYHDKEKYGYVSDEFDSKETISLIKKAIENVGHQVALVEADEDFYGRVKELKEQGKVDFVFNYAVGIYGRSRETHVPAMCEMLRIPYSASDVLTTAICQDKARANDLLNFYGIKTPAHQIFVNPEEKLSKKLHFPLIIKYNYQGSSIGLKDNEAIANNEDDLKKRIKHLLKFPQPVLVEEYIDGREFTVGFFGNFPEIHFFSLVEILPSNKQKEGNWVFNSRKQPVSNEVSIDKNLKNKIYEICSKTIKNFELKDWGRIDLRVKNKEVYILEVNNCAHLSKRSVYFEGAKTLKLTHKKLITNMLNGSLKRFLI